MIWNRSSLVFAALWLVTCALALPRTVTAQDYTIGPEDKLQISVWRHPELDKTVTVEADGDIVFAPVGSIKAAGSTAAQLGERLGDRLSAYLRETVSASVTVIEFMSQSVFVSGSVARPGRYGFERMPGLLDVINHAGGALPEADLRRVQILRREGDRGRQVLAVDLSEALQRGSEAGLPTPQAGDIILVPSAAALGGALTVDAAGVLGEVLRPGLYPVGTGQDLWWVLAQAGGPTTRANLGGIKVLRKEQDTRRATTVNLQQVLDRGSRSPITIQPGDLVYLEPKGLSAWDGFVTLLGITRDVASLIAIVDVLQKGR